MNEPYEFVDGTNPSRDFRREQEARAFERQVEDRAGELINLCEGEHREDWCWELARVLARKELTPKKVGPAGVQLGIDTIDDLETFAAEHIKPKLEGLKVLLTSIKEDLENA